MGWLARALGRWKYPEQRVWIVVLAWTVVLAVLVAASAAGYSGLIYARTAVTLSPSHEIAWSGTSSSGVLLSNGTVTYHLSLTVTNGGDRALALNSVAYRSWMEDLPAEAGLTSRDRTDSVLTNETGTHLFFTVFLGSFDVTDILVPAHGSRTTAFSFNLTSAIPGTFSAVQNITAYAGVVLGNAARVPWVHWVQISLIIQGVPPPGLASNLYLTELTRIVLEEGQNLG